ncbi:MAG: hypothetical protein PHC89_00525 [Candidatus Pacebacteria bacterium]|nr:hypothetical protein [Candidatus Paceibacterota bacterium]
MITLAQLNKKWWYRLLKVVFVAAYLFVLLFGVITFISNYVNNKTHEKEEELVSSSQEINTMDIKNYLYNLSIELGYTPEQAAQMVQKSYEPIEQKRAIENNQVSKFSLDIENIQSLREILVFSLIWTIVTSLIFEGTRRLFYYIILGKFRPTN